MGYRTLRHCIDDLEATRQLVRIEQEIDPYLEAAEIQRRVYLAGGPALYFAHVKGCKFPMVSNLFGSIERARYLFRDSLDRVRQLIELKIDPMVALRNPWRYRGVPLSALRMLPRKVRSGPVMQQQCRIQDLPQLKSWPSDGGAFITLPQVYSEDVNNPGVMRSNLGMYRVQISGGQYLQDQEIGMHYQIHRGIGVHHSAAIQAGQPLRVNIFVGGTPAMTLSAVMPLPEGLAELTFAGALANHRIPMASAPGGLPIYAEADFCITGTIIPEKQLPEGPFGDHLGYYSLSHDFPVMKVERVYHRSGAIWPFTVVGRPPQEDTTFGQLIHEITGPIIPTVIAGVKAVHAVDAAGVHPLLLAIGSERYQPYAKPNRPQELLTQANAILGQGQMSLAKYLLIVSADDDPQLDIHRIDRFLMHLLSRVDWQRDLHFQTRTTIDTLDYTGQGFNQGSKVVIAAVGSVRRELPSEISGTFSLPEGYRNPRVCLPGVVAIEGPKLHSHGEIPENHASVRSGHTIKPDVHLQEFIGSIALDHPLNQFPLWVIVDNSEFTAQSLNNFLWSTFTRSDPASDIYGISAFTEQKHWGCRGSLVIDARVKPHHAPPLVEDPAITAKVDRLAARGGPLHGII